MRKIIEKALAKGAERCEVFHLNSLNTDVDYEASKLKNARQHGGDGIRAAAGQGRPHGVRDDHEARTDSIDWSTTRSRRPTCGDKAEFGFAGGAEAAGVKLVDERVKKLSSRRDDDALRGRHREAPGLRERDKRQLGDDAQSPDHERRYVRGVRGHAGAHALPVLPLRHADRGRQHARGRRLLRRHRDGRRRAAARRRDHRGLHERPDERRASRAVPRP